MIDVPSWGGWTAAGLSETPGECFSLDFVIGSMSLLVCVSFVSPNNVPLSSFHLLWSCFFVHSLPILGLQRRFPKCKGKKLKSHFVLSSILSLSNVSEYFQYFLYFTCTSFSLQLWWTRWSHITENVLCGINKVEVIKT